MELITLNKHETPTLEIIVKMVQSIKIEAYRLTHGNSEKMMPTLIIAHPNTMRQLFMSISKEIFTNQVFDMETKNIHVLGCKLKIIESITLDELEIIIK
jgi:hypothetical protein